LSADTSSTTVPARRYGPSFDYDNNGGFFIFGGFSNSERFSLWRYSKSTGLFALLDGNDTSNTYPIGKPFPRQGHASWIDQTGNLWIFGGFGRNNDITAGRLIFLVMKLNDYSRSISLT
jgi:hypothetical protein